MDVAGGLSHVVAEAQGAASSVVYVRAGDALLGEIRGGVPKYHEAEAMFLRNARLATFIGRLLPVVRHLISLPAGVFGMAWGWFLAITALGAALWCAVLVALGYYFGEPAVALVQVYMHELAIAVGIALVAFVLWFATGIWVLYRIIRGWLALASAKAMPYRAAQGG